MANTLFIGKVYQHIANLPSTNDYARELCTKSKPPEGMVIRADSQSAGRGQFGSRWESEPGKNLLLSIVLYPHWLRASDQFRMSEAVALAVWDTVSGTTFFSENPDRRITIKWPNDIYIDSRKTAGILIQNTLKGEMLDTSIIGIGLNVNQLTFPETLPNATSMALASNTVFNLDVVMHGLFENLERRYLQLKNSKTGTLKEAYHAHLLGRGERHSFQRADGTCFQGEIEGVAADGRLMIQTDNGTEHFAVKSVQMLLNSR